MDLSEINLPPSSEIFEPQTSLLQELKNDDIFDKLVKSNLGEFLSRQETLIIINDHHRSTPSHKILKLIGRLDGTKKIEAIIIATGTHGPPTSQEIKNLIRNADKILDTEVFVHDCNSHELINIGQTSYGTPIEINPLLFEIKQVLAINSVEPHFFAGFTGGIKSLVPGLASKRTVEKNHSWAMDPRTGPAIIEGNPLIEDLWEALDMLTGDVRGIQMVNQSDKIYFVSVDKLRPAFEEARAFASKIYVHEVSRKYDVIVSFVFKPLNRSLYQAQKGIENTRQALKPGGTIVLVAECKNGIGNDAFYRTILTYSNPNQVLQSLTRETYKFGDHKVYKFASLTKDSNLTVISNLDSKTVSNIFADSLELGKLENFLRDQFNRGSMIAIVLDAGNTILREIKQ